MLETILDLATTFRASGKELYMVGGTVRDLLLRRETTSPDIDLTTNARPDEIKRLVAGTHPAAVFSIGEKFGTVRIHYRRAPQTDKEGEADAQREPGAQSAEATSPEPVAIVSDHPADVDIVEITTYRSDRYDPDSRKPDVTFGDTLTGDLLRRDFTINAMARDPLTGAILDPYGGRADLERRLIRAVGDDPERRFDEDPLRMLRAVRFAAQLDFQIEEATAQAIVRQAATLGKISRERIRDEFTKALTTLRPDLAIRLIVDLGLAPYVLPEVLELRGVSQLPTPKAPRSKDVYAHVLRVVAGIPNRPATRWAALLHDIAKPRTRSVENGQVHFFGHEDVGAVMARDILRRLKFDKPFIDHVARLVKLHMRANGYLPDWTDGAVRRLMLDAGDALADLLDLSRADITSYRPDKQARAAARTSELEARIAWLRAEAERVPIKSPLDGNDLMALFDRGPGPWLRPVKDYLLGLVIDGQLAAEDRERATELAREFMAGDEGGTGNAEDAQDAEARGGRAGEEKGETEIARNAAKGREESDGGLDGGSSPSGLSTAERRRAQRRQSRGAVNGAPGSPGAPGIPPLQTGPDSGA